MLAAAGATGTITTVQSLFFPPHRWRDWCERLSISCLPQEEAFKQQQEAQLTFSNRAGHGVAEKRPEDSVYYHPTLNPEGIPPPGKPQVRASARWHARACGPTSKSHRPADPIVLHACRASSSRLCLAKAQSLSAWMHGTWHARCMRQTQTRVCV